MIVAEEAVLTQELFWLLWKHDFFKSFYWFALKQTFFLGGRGGEGGVAMILVLYLLYPIMLKYLKKFLR